MSTGGAGKDPVDLSFVFDFFAISPGILTSTYDGAGTINSTFQPDKVFNGAKNRKKLSGELLQTNFVQVLDFREIRTKIEKKIISLNKEINAQKTTSQEEINKKLSDSLGFEPTIGDIFRIICNNTQAMTVAIHEISKQAENPAIKEDRNDVLEDYQTDIPDDTNTSYAWPKVFKNIDGKGYEEIYLGEIDRATETTFPELKFVRSVFDNLNKKRKELKQISRATNLVHGLDNDQWFPLNPLDYLVNPFLKTNNVNTAVLINNEFAKQLFIRTALLTTYSQFNKSVNVTAYAKFDGINANQSIFSSLVRNFILSNLKLADIKTAAAELGIIESEIKNNKRVATTVEIDGTKYYRLREVDLGSGVDLLPKIGHTKISGRRSDNVYYIEFDNVGITQNAIKLYTEIGNTKNKEYNTIVSPSFNSVTNPKYVSETYFRSFYYNKNYTTNIFNNVWIQEVGDKLLAADESIINEKNKVYKIKEISNIDFIPPKYINILNPTTTSTKARTEPLLTDNDIYTNQTIKASKALLLLTTLPFKTFTDAVLTIFDTPKSKSARVVNLPTYYVYYIGGLLWRESYINPTTNQQEDPIIWTSIYAGGDNLGLKTATNKYFTKLGFQGNSGADIVLEKAITQLPEKTKSRWINKFKDWVNGFDADNGFDKFELSVKQYTESVDPSTKEAGGKIIVSHLEDITNMILPAPMIFFPDDTTALNLKNGLLVSEEDFNQYYSIFYNQFKLTNQTNTKGADADSGNNVSNNNSDKQVKLQIYNYFKNINDKWVSDGGDIFNACGTAGKPLFEYFKFIDRGWSDIGDEAVINLNSILTLSNSLDTSVYFYISKILRDSNFLLQILPNYINYKDETEVKENVYSYS